MNAASYKLAMNRWWGVCLVRGQQVKDKQSLVINYDYKELDPLDPWLVWVSKSTLHQEFQIFDTRIDFSQSRFSLHFKPLTGAVHQSRQSRIGKHTDSWGTSKITSGFTFHSLEWHLAHNTLNNP